MLSSQLYPVFLSLKERHCLIVGFGSVGQRKLKGILPCNPQSILILDTRPLQDIFEKWRELLSYENIKFEQRQCSSEDITNSFLVFAATSDFYENKRICAMCCETNVLCNSATNPDKGSFIVPSIVREHNLCAAISTGGASPLLTRTMRQDLEQWLNPRAKIAWLLGKMRPLILALKKDSNWNKEIFQMIITSDIPTFLADGDYGKCIQMLSAMLPDIPTSELEKIFSELTHVFS